jgi:hypothetical protein
MASLKANSNPDRIVDQAEEKLTAIKDFKEEIKTLLAPILE